jgi:hypothetical protein
MKVRAATAGTWRRARLAAVGCGLVTILASLTVSACSPSSSGALPTPTSSSSVSPSTTASPSPSTSASPTSSPSPSPTVSPTASPTASPSPYPSVAPATGGGGTAGFQHGLLFGLGVAAILIGAGSIIYRRRAVKSR